MTDTNSTPWPDIERDDQIAELLWQCFSHFAHLDHSNAAIHMAPVRYSPITFRLAEVVNDNELLPSRRALLTMVLKDLHAYPMDTGR